MIRIPYLDLKKITELYQPDISQCVNEVVSSGRYLYGEKVSCFEKDFSSYIGSEYCIGVANGLDALTLILMAYRKTEEWSNESEIIVPAFTFIATAEAVRRAGLKPVFCDIDSNFLLDPKQVRKSITPRTKAIIPVHLYGKVGQMDEICEMAKMHKLKVYKY